MIGRRPSLPYWIHEHLQENPAYQPVFDLFIAMTEIKSAQRPTAAKITELITA